WQLRDRLPFARGNSGIELSDAQLLSLIPTLTLQEKSKQKQKASAAAAVAFGKALFFDPNFSANGKISCATCHIPERFFTDGLPKSVGLGTSLRHSPSLLNSREQFWFFWDGRADSL